MLIGSFAYSWWYAAGCPRSTHAWCYSSPTPSSTQSWCFAPCCSNFLCIRTHAPRYITECSLAPALTSSRALSQLSAPSAPVAPSAPGAPGAPFAPSAPGAFFAPGAPSAPVAPGAPGTPSAPTAHPAHPAHPAQSAIWCHGLPLRCIFTKVSQPSKWKNMRFALFLGSAHYVDVVLNSLTSSTWGHRLAPGMQMRR